MIMKNLWIQTEHAFVTWSADLTKFRGEPSILLFFLEQVLQAGSKHEVFTVVEAPEINFKKEHGQEIYDFLNDIFHVQKVIDMFAFTGAAMAPGAPRSSTVESKVAWFDASGKCVESVCSNLAIVLQNLEPIEGAIPAGFMKHLPPVRITGPRVTYDNGSAVGSSKHIPDHPIMIYFAIHSDIWFPWIYGSAHPLCDYKHMFDNHELAQRHTPRLNKFLRDVSAIVRDIGGLWTISIPETGKDAKNWLDDKGFIELSPQSPQFVMLNSAYEVEWY
ncbi:MAG: hypothetical protein F6K11_28580 [Leptolyngbya sp. SIO3F4]|nr:hypothetical protein [Leptolyngbya sp. SIO3F4]